MNDYNRLVSYIYSYPGGIRDKNVGFAKAEVRSGMFKLNVSLKGVYTDAPETFGVYFIVDRNVAERGSSTLLHIGNVIVKEGTGQYTDLFNSENVNSTGYCFTDIGGVAVAREDNQFYMMFSLWDDESFDLRKVKFVPKDYKKLGTYLEESVEEEQIETESSEVERLRTEEIIADVKQENEGIELQIDAMLPIMQSELADLQPVKTPTQQVEEPPIPEMEALFKNSDFINAFDDDYYYDCIEVTPEQLRKLPIGEEPIVNNSFLEHGYYNFKHLLLGRVRPNERHTEFFIGVPGMYCNRERFMATMFGFNNFKKSHRSEYTNPYFGYWYQEM